MELYETIKCKIIHFFEGIANLIYYFRVIWRDRDYDYLYVHSILLRKFEKMLDFYNRNGNNYQKEINRPIRLCLVILKRNDDDFYYNTINGLQLAPDGYLKAEMSELRDMKIFYNIIKKYHQYWWE